MNYIVSSQFVPAAGGQYILNHGFGVKPSMAGAFYICITAELGYSVGDTIPLFGGSNGTGTYGNSIWVTQTIVGWQMNNGGSPVVMARPAGTMTATTFAKWRLVLWAVK